MLKEVLVLVEEIRHRFYNQGISVEALNSRQRYDQNGYIILKTVIGGAFYRKYVKSEYKNIDEIKRYNHSTVFEKEESKRSLIYNS